MPSGATYWGSNLVQAVNNGSVPEVRLDDMATRIIAAWYKMGQDSSERPQAGSGIPEDLSQPHTRVIGWNASFKDTLYRGALEGHVLLKNEGALPLKSSELISVFGYSAKTPDEYNYGVFGFNGGSYPLAYGLDYNGTGSFISGVTSGIARNGTSSQVEAQGPASRRGYPRPSRRSQNERRRTSPRCTRTLTARTRMWMLPPMFALSTSMSLLQRAQTGRV